MPCSTFFLECAQGEWGYVDNGTTVDLYFWPNDTNNVAAGIEYSQRTRGINAYNESNLEFRGLIIENVSSAASAETVSEYAISLNAQVGSYHTDVTLDNILIRNSNRAERAYGPIFARNLHNLQIRNVEIDGAVNQAGIVHLAPKWNSPAWHGRRHAD